MTNKGFSDTVDKVGSKIPDDPINGRIMDGIIVRESADDFAALQIADAMQSLEHVEVVSVVFQDGEPLMARQPRGRWYVYAKYAKGKVTPDQIDVAISFGVNSSR